MNASARVELHEPRPGDKPDYDLLHSSMSVEGWPRHIYVMMTKKRLPTGVYRKMSAVGSMQDLMSSILRAVSKTGHKASIYLTRGEEELTSGLENDPVQPGALLRAARMTAPTITAPKPLTAPVSRLTPQYPNLSALEAYCQFSANSTPTPDSGRSAFYSAFLTSSLPKK